MLVFSIMIPSCPFSTIQQASISMFLCIMSINIKPFSSLLEIRQPLSRIDPYLWGIVGFNKSEFDMDFRGLKVAANFSSSFLNLILGDICGETIGTSSLKHISFSKRFRDKGEPASSSTFFRFKDFYSIGCKDFNSVPLKMIPDPLLN